MRKLSLTARPVAVLALVAALGMGSALVGCDSASTGGSAEQNGQAEQAAEATPESVIIQSKNAAGEVVDLEVPYDAQRIAVLDMASLDILDALGLGDRVVGTASTSIDYLQDYVNNDEVANLGTVKEADMEAVAAAEPDVIFIGGRLSKSYDELSKIAPVVYLSTDAEKGLVESTRDNANLVASMFGKESEVDGLMSGFEGRIEALKEAADGQTAIVGLYTNGGFNVLGNDGRCSIIGTEVGFTNLAAGQVTSTHGNEVSFETLVAEDPDYIFVMNRDAAIGQGSAEAAKDVVENDLTKQTKAYNNGHIVYLEHPAVWYTAEGGISALDTMLADLESALK